MIKTNMKEIGIVLLSSIPLALLLSLFSETIFNNLKALTDIIQEKPLMTILSYLSILGLALLNHSIRKLINNQIIQILSLSLCLGLFINYIKNGFTEDEWWNFLYILAYYLIYIGFIFLGRLFNHRHRILKNTEKILKIFSQNKTEEQRYPFLLDEPLDTIHESKISKEDLSLLKNKLLATKGSSQSFVLGIIGAWGSGKTSLGKQLHNSLGNKHSKECSTIWFEPWKFKGENSVQDSLIEHLASKLPAQSSALKEYGDLLKHEAIPAFIKFFIDLVHHSNSEGKFEELKESLEKHGKQIYIFIDDLDRLDAKEILDIFKLIRSTLSLQQLSYVLIYDKSHIESVLESSTSQKNDSRNFLDKIVQVEYYIPSKGRMSEYYTKRFFRQFDKSSNGKPNRTDNENLFQVSEYEYEILEILKKNLESNLEEESRNFKRIFDAHIFTIRDLKRLINNFLISINTIREDWKGEFEKAGHNTLSETKKYEVYFQFLLEIMKTKYPEAYDRFYFKDSGFLVQPKTCHDELYNICSTGTVQGQKHMLDNYVQEFSKMKLSELLNTIFGRNILSSRLAQLNEDIKEHENNRSRSLKDLEKQIAKVDGESRFQVFYTEKGYFENIQDYNEHKNSYINLETYLLVKPYPDGSFPNPRETDAYETERLDNQLYLLLGLRFEKFANENGFLCHTAHYDKYFGKMQNPKNKNQP
ncbi:MAG: P-loop NTPase fold protein [bacterium]